MNSIAQTNRSENQLSEKMQYFLRRYHVSRILRSANAYKHGGFPVLSLFLVAFSTVFTHRSFFMQIHLQRTAFPFAKDFSYGFRMLTLCWSDGSSLLPVSHVLLSTENPKNRLNASSEKVDARTSGGKRRKLAQRKATEVILCLLQEAKEAAIPARHVLFDTWFCSPTSLLSVHELGYEVVAMAKKTEKIHYLLW